MAAPRKTTKASAKPKRATQDVATTRPKKTTKATKTTKTTKTTKATKATKATRPAKVVMDVKADKTPKRATPTAVLSVDRRSEALALRKLGATYVEIGEQLGVTGGRAWQIVQAAFAEQRETMAEKAADAIDVELLRLDAMLFALRTKLMKGNCRAIETALRISDRRAKLLGLDAATKTEVTGHHGGPIAIEDARARLLEAISRITGQADTEPDAASSGDAAT